MSWYTGKRVALTGGSSGIGLAAALQLARDGAHVALLARNPERLEAARAQVEAAGAPTAIAISVDVTDAQAVEDAAAQVLSGLGGLDVLVCNAGYARCAPLAEQSMDQVRHLMETNYFGHVHMVRALLPHFQSQKSGHISLVSSMLGFLSIYGYGAYSASKFAIVGLAEALRQELRPSGVKVGLFFPPTTDTPGLEEENEDKPAVTWAVEGTTRKFSPDEVARALLKGIAKGRFVDMAGIDSWVTWYASKWAPWLVHLVADHQMDKALRAEGRS